MLLEDAVLSNRVSVDPWGTRSSHPEFLSDSTTEDLKLARDAFLVNIFSVAALAWVVYDMVLNCNREISLVWRRWHERKGRHTRRLYIIVRYFSVINLAWYVGVNTSLGLSRNFCRSWYYIVLINTTLITLLPDAMLLIRVNAVYTWNIRTLLFTVFLFIIQMTTSLVAGTLAIDSSRVNPIGMVPGCPISLSKPIARFTLMAWIPSIIAQITYLLLILNTLTSLLRVLNESRLKPLQNPAWMADAMPPGASNMVPESTVMVERDPNSNKAEANNAIVSKVIKPKPETPAKSNQNQTEPSIPFPSLPPIPSNTTFTPPVASSSKLPRTRSISYQSQDLPSGTIRSKRTTHSSINDSSTNNLLPLTRSHTYSHSLPRSLLSSYSDLPLNQSAQSFKLHRLRSIPLAESTTRKALSRIPARTLPRLSLSTLRSLKRPAVSNPGQTSTNGTEKTRPPFFSRVRTCMNLRLRTISHSLPVIVSIRMLFSWRALTQVKKLVPTMMVFVAHGGFYFFFAILAKIANAVILMTYSGPLQGAAIPWMMAVYPILVTHIYLSMVQYLHYGVPSKSERPRMLASLDREHYASGFGGSEYDPEYDDDEIEEGYERDIEFSRANPDPEWDAASEEITSFSVESPRGSRSRRTSRVRRISRPTRGDIQDAERRRWSRGPRLGRITFAARESLRSPSVIDFGDEDY